MHEPYNLSQSKEVFEMKTYHIRKIPAKLIQKMVPRAKVCPILNKVFAPAKMFTLLLSKMVLTLVCGDFFPVFQRRYLVRYGFALRVSYIVHFNVIIN